MKKVKLHLGCGDNYLYGYINCDLLKNIKTDRVFDLNKFPYPFRNNFADEILMDNVLEHLDDIPSVMTEIYRILKNKGLLRIYVPYAKSDGAYQDPTHKHYFTEKSMNYFCVNYDYNYYTNIRFSLEKAELFTNNDGFLIKLRNMIPFRKLLRYFLYNMYDGIYFELKAIK